MRSGTSRRELLAALCGCGTTGIAGCLSGLSGSRSRGTETVTPAPVPTTGPTRLQTTMSRVRCPELPTNAEVYLCSSTGSGGNDLHMITEAGTSTRDPAPGGFVFTLSNETSVAFQTGRDWWTLAARGGGGWVTVDQGDGTDRVTVDPGGTFVWSLGGDGDGPRTECLDVDVRAEGWHALSITGYVASGELIAVIAPFRPEDGTD